LVTDVGLHTGKITRRIDTIHDGKGGREQQASVSETERYMARRPNTFL
jgi:hypothetical protein